jgi:hypothetical protein
MNMEKKSYIWFLFTCIFALVTVMLSSGLVSAAYLWSVDFETSIGSYPVDSFEAGVDDAASDGYDSFVDAIQISTPASQFSLMMTQAGIYPLMQDFRPDFTDNKTWQIKKNAFVYPSGGLTGMDDTTWTLNNVPSSVDLTLIDYGNDPTRTNIVNTIDMKLASSYGFSVQNVNGDYRYLDFIANKTTTQGDVNDDCVVNIIDLVIVARAYGSRPGHSRWNPDADLNNDGRINIMDLVLVAVNYGDTC